MIGRAAKLEQSLSEVLSQLQSPGTIEQLRIAAERADLYDHPNEPGCSRLRTFYEAARLYQQRATRVQIVLHCARCRLSWLAGMYWCPQCHAPASRQACS